MSIDGYHTCGITSTGAAKCWGSNYAGQLGNGTKARSFTPEQVSGLSSGVTHIAARGGPYSSSGSCAIENDGVLCWGDSWGDIPAPVGNLSSDVTAMDFYPTSGTGTGCAVKTSKLYCWGDGYSAGAWNQPPGPAVEVPNISGVTDVALSSDSDAQICAAAAGGVKCWYVPGNWFGDEVTDVLAAGSGVTKVTAGERHFCALIDDGTVKCWGDNYNGQLGDGTTEDRSVPITVSGITSATAIDAGSSHTCALENGAAKCWGSSTAGQLGILLPTDDGLTPVTLSGFASGVTAVSAGTSSTCAIKAGEAWCLGWNRAGQLGAGRGADSNVPSAIVPTGGGVTDISMGGTTGDNFYESFACVIAGGSVKCWGNNSGGQLGNGDEDGKRVYSPVHPVGLNGATETATHIDTTGHQGEYGEGHTCAVVDAGVKCWGLNTHGQIGDGTTENAYSPVDVPGLTSGVSQVAVRSTTSCALLNSGAVKCWGNGYGTSPVTLPEITAGSAISGGSTFFCAVDAGAVKCWGTGTVTSSTSPTSVSGLTSGVTAVSAGYSTACAIVSGAVKCWGRGLDGELGSGTFANSSTPVQVSGITSGATTISVGGSDYEYGSRQVCAVVSGAAKCWGGNESGQLGNGTTTDSNVPVQVEGLTSGVWEIEAGYGASCASVGVNLQVRCWGAGDLGQLADGYLYAFSAFKVVEPTSVSLTTPYEGQTIKTVTPTFSWVTDGITIVGATCTIDSAAATSCSSPWAAPTLSEGAHSFTLQVTDGEGGLHTRTAAFTVDTADYDDPIVTITSPTNNQVISGGSLEVLFTISDLSPVTTQCSVDGGAMSTCTSPWNLSGLASGSHFVEVRAQDSFGNVASEYVDFSIAAAPDTTPPTITITSPANGLVTSEPFVDLIFTKSDNSGGFVDCDRFSGEVIPLDIGVTNIAVYCEDVAGNGVTAVVSVTRTATAGSDSPPSQPGPPNNPAPAAPSVASKTKSIKPTGKAVFSVTCAAQCTVSPTVKIGKKSYKVPARKLPTGTTSVTIKLPKSVQKKIAAAKKKLKKKLKVTLLAAVSYADGTKSTLTLKVAP